MEVRAFGMNTNICNTILSITEMIKNAIYSIITIEHTVVEINRVSCLTITQKYEFKNTKRYINNREQIQNFKSH